MKPALFFVVGALILGAGISQPGTETLRLTEAYWAGADEEVCDLEGPTCDEYFLATDTANFSSCSPACGTTSIGPDQCCDVGTINCLSSECDKSDDVLALNHCITGAEECDPFAASIDCGIAQIGTCSPTPIWPSGCKFSACAGSESYSCFNAAECD